MHLVAPFHTPHMPTRVAYRDAGKAAGAVLFDEGERRHRCAVASARAGSKIEALGWTRIAPDRAAPCRQRYIASRAPPHFRSNAPEREDQPHHDNAAGNDAERNENQFGHRH